MPSAPRFQANGRQFRAVLCCAVLGCATLAEGIPLIAKEPSVPVPPSLELEILDPGVHPLGNPRVVTKPADAEYAEVEIPPTVIVHRFYYTGNRSFQGPLLAGGPCILVVQHPETGERQYVDVQLLPGAPRIIYSACAIEYDYGKQGVKLTFGAKCPAQVTYRHCQPPARSAGKFLVKTSGEMKALSSRIGLAQVGSDVQQGAKKAAGAVVDGVRNTGALVYRPAKAAMEALPGMKPLQTTVERRAEESREGALSRARQELADREATIRTVR